jgi:hypothetical protein
VACPASGRCQLHGGCAATQAMAGVPRQKYQSAPPMGDGTTPFELQFA